MKIAVFVAAMQGSGGIFQYTLSLLQALYGWDTDHEFVVIRFKGNKLFLGEFPQSNWSYLELDPEITRSPRIPQFLTGDGLDLERPGKNDVAINQKLEDFFVSHNIGLIIYPAPVYVFFECRIPYIMVIHDLQHRLQPEFPEVSVGGIWKQREFVFRNGVRYAEAVVTDSETGKEDVLNFYGHHISEERVYPLPFLPFYRPCSEKTDKENQLKVKTKYNLPDNFLFYPAQFWLHKNHSRLIHALHVLRFIHNIDIPLVLVGSYNAGIEGRYQVFSNVMTLAEQLQVKDLVHYLGYVSNEEMLLLYSMAKALTMPTFFGPTNIPFLEAWAFGCPVVASDIRGIREQIGDAGLLVDPKDVFKIAAAISKLWKNDGLRKSLIEKGYRKIETYKPNDFAEKIYGIISDVV